MARPHRSRDQVEGTPKQNSTSHINENRRAHGASAADHQGRGCGRYPSDNRAPDAVKGHRRAGAAELVRSLRNFRGCEIRPKARGTTIPRTAAKMRPKTGAALSTSTAKR